MVVGLDRNAPGEPAITSRGYGVGQYTLFHHPPTPDEVRDVILDPCANVQKSIRELAAKFAGFLNGATRATRADDRLADAGSGPLRLCRYAPGDPRYMTRLPRVPGRRRNHGDRPGADAVPSRERVSRRTLREERRLRLALRRAALQRRRREFLPLPGAGSACAS